MAWLSANLANILIIAVLALIVGLLIRSMIRDKKAGKSSCGGCTSCAACSGGCSGNCGTAIPDRPAKESGK